MKYGSVTVEVHHQARMNAANTVDVDQCELVEFNACESSSLKHRGISQINWRGKTFEGGNRGRLDRRSVFKSEGC